MEELVLQSPKTFEEKVQTSIDRIRQFEPPEGYYVAFSGGKDSQTVYHLCKEAGVKFDAHYNLTTVDPPELVYFIRDNYPDVIIDRPELTMWQLIEKKGLPTRLKRFCCEYLKERGGEDRICITGVRWEESLKRKSRHPFEIVTKKREDKKLFNDNDEGRRLFETCIQKGKRVVNPIIDLLEVDVWRLIKQEFKISYCSLYDEGHDRIGCVGCPISCNRKRDFERWPKYYLNYYKAVERFLPGYLERCKVKKRKPFRKTAQAWMDWWIYEQDLDPDYLGVFDDEIA
jgi:phosphoadenosine phosphosulfate reductase